MAIAAIADAVLDTLQSTGALYGTGEPTPSDAPTALRQVADTLRQDPGQTPEGYAAAAAAHLAAADKHAEHQDRVRRAVTAAAAGTSAGRTALTGVLNDYQARVAVLAPIADTRTAGAALLDASHASVSAAGAQLNVDVQAANKTAATIAALSEADRAAGRRGRRRRRRAAQSSDGAQGGDAVAAASGWLGTPYVWGGGGVSGPTAGGFDCSGLTQYAIAHATHGHVILPRATHDQFRSGVEVPVSDVQPGDLVFPLADFHSAGPGHVQLAAGNGLVIEAAHTGADVRLTPMSPDAVVVRVL